MIASNIWRCAAPNNTCRMSHRMTIKSEAAQAGQGQREGEGCKRDSIAGQHQARQVGAQGQGAQMLQHLRAKCMLQHLADAMCASFERWLAPMTHSIQ